MYRKAILIFSIAIIFSSITYAQDVDPGGLGSGGNGDVKDQDGGSGTTGGNQGSQVPIDGGISILIAAGAVALGKKLYKKKEDKPGATL